MKAIGKGTKIHEYCFIGNDVKIGENCRIQAFAFIPDNVKIGDDVFIGPHVCFCNDKYPPSKGKWKKQPPTVVCDRAVIGAGAVILPNITIHADAKVAAGAVVTKDVRPGKTVAGVPAHEIRSNW